MTGTLLRSQHLTQSPPQNQVFFCPEESHFYSHCLERLVLSRCDSSNLIVEFGCGDGSPVINSLLRSQFDGTIYGYELNAAACNVARSRIEQCNLRNTYIIHNQSFFDAEQKADYLIANPPYLPASDNKICMPLLHGGTDGAAITNRLLTLGYANLMVLVSSYSNPVGTIDQALESGYTVADFMVTPLPFGYYSSEPKVKNSIVKLRQQGKAFYSSNIYFLAGVLFRQRSISDVDLSTELIQTMTAL